MDEKTVLALLNVKREMGAEFLRNAPRVAAFLTDFLPAHPGERQYGERHVLVRLLKAGVPQQLAVHTAPSDAEFAALAARWAAAFFLDEQITHQALRILHFAVHARAGAAADMPRILGPVFGAAPQTTPPAPQKNHKNHPKHQRHKHSPTPLPNWKKNCVPPRSRAAWRRCSAS